MCNKIDEFIIQEVIDGQVVAAVYVCKPAFSLACLWGDSSSWRVVGHGECLLQGDFDKYAMTLSSLMGASMYSQKEATVLHWMAKLIRMCSVLHCLIVQR